MKENFEKKMKSIFSRFPFLKWNWIVCANDGIKARSKKKIDEMKRELWKFSLPKSGVKSGFSIVMSMKNHFVKVVFEPIKSPRLDVNGHPTVTIKTINGCSIFLSGTCQFVGVLTRTYRSLFVMTMGTQNNVINYLMIGLSAIVSLYTLVSYL